MSVSLAILAAGRSSRFGRPKQLEPVGPSGEALFEYAVYDAIRAGCDRVIFVTSPEDEIAFRAQAQARLGMSIAAEIVTQRLDDLPPGFRAPEDRVSPWGTGHAVLALSRVIRDSFIVLNADDFYGPRVIDRLVRRLRDARMTGDPRHFLAGYQLGETPISSSGGVNRAICSVDASLQLEHLEEVLEIRPSDGEFVGLASGQEIGLKPEVLCSMNLWAFQPTIFEQLFGAFHRFHARLKDPMTDEFLLSDAVGGLVGTGRTRVRVVPAEEKAFGMTFEEDVAAVASGVAMSVAVGDYPTDLGEWFDSRRSHIPG
ncbi:MAG: NTP transferase domain-containing protein [Gemmatimonadota bacterium]|nr:NTP transferase domain-containing protein [Gemmatimonadota bacterium]